MKLREQLEYAAKAIGYSVQPGHVGPECWAGWNHRTDQADSDRMACDLEINTFWSDGFVTCSANDGVHAKSIPHDNTLEGKCAAVREARLAVAVEIGRQM